MSLEVLHKPNGFGLPPRPDDDASPFNSSLKAPQSPDRKDEITVIPVSTGLTDLGAAALGFRHSEAQPDAPIL
jgi:hypothetical protein